MLKSCSYILRIMEWSDNRLLKLNLEKCKVMHIGRIEILNEYSLKNYIGNQTLTEATE